MELNLTTFCFQFIYADESKPVLTVNETVKAASLEAAISFLREKYSPTPLLNLQQIESYHLKIQEDEVHGQ